MQPFIQINGHAYPAPRRGLKPTIATTVDAGRNANNVVVGQRVGRDNQKLDNLYWGYLDAETWKNILQEFKNFYVTVTYPDMSTGAWTTRKMYPGDRSAEPLHISETTGLPLDYINCKVNLIDVGEAL